MTQQSLGLIETIGLVAAIRAADTAVKAANVQLIGYELAKGGGMTVVKVCGDVGAVKAAVAAATAAVGRFVSATVIARPAEGLAAFVASRETVGNPAACVPARGDAPETVPAHVSPPVASAGTEAAAPAQAERSVTPMEAQAELPAASATRTEPEPPVEPEPRVEPELRVEPEQLVERQPQPEPERPAAVVVDHDPKTVAAPAKRSGPAGQGSRKGKRKGGQ